MFNPFLWTPQRHNSVEKESDNEGRGGLQGFSIKQTRASLLSLPLSASPLCVHVMGSLMKPQIRAQAYFGAEKHRKSIEYVQNSAHIGSNTERFQAIFGQNLVHFL